MPGETILVVEDSPVSLKLTATALRKSGYKVQIASTAEQAWSMLRFLQPRLILVDILLPGMSGLELTSLVKQEPRLHDSLVVALTACAMEEDEEKALLAGCDGYLTKPIDTGTLLMRVREYLGGRAESSVEPQGAGHSEPDPVSPPPVLDLPESEMEDLRRSFLSHGLVQSQELLSSLDGAFDAAKTSRLLHQWTGVGGLLGFPAISVQSREVEDLLRTAPQNVQGLRVPLGKLARAFADPGEVAQSARIPETIVQELKGKRVGLIGLAALEAERVCGALEAVGGRPRLFEADEPPEGEPVRQCSAVIVHVRPETMSCKWLSPDFPVPPLLPLLFIGNRDHLLSLDPRVQARAREYLIDGWQPEEALMRLSFALTRTATPLSSAPVRAPSATDVGRSVSTQDSPSAIRAEVVVIADDDETVRTLVQSTLRRYGWQCRLADNGADALQLIREQRPQAAVLDVNMPGMDGFEVLAAIRAEALPVRAILLTARQLENDILRGFSLGADDYVVKPFNPVELAARLKRLFVA